MATRDGANCIQHIESKYKCKHFKTIRKKELKDCYENFFAYRHVKEEIILMEKIQESVDCKNPGRQKLGLHKFKKYSKKRCNCKIKKISPVKLIDKDDDDDNNSQEVIQNNYGSNSCHIRKISFFSLTTSPVKCTSILGRVLDWTTFASPLGAVGKTTHTYIHFNPLGDTFAPYELEASVSPSMNYNSLLTQTKCTKFPHSKFLHKSINWRTWRPQIQSTTVESQSSSSTLTFCDRLNNYANINLSCKLNGLIAYTSAKKKTSIEAMSSLKCQRQKHTKFGCNYMFILIMIAKELIRHSGDTLCRIRRKSQFLLSIFILLQLLMAAPVTHCTTPPNTNQTIAAILNTFPSTSFTDKEMSSSITEATVALNNWNIENRKLYDQEKISKSQRSSSSPTSSPVSQSSSPTRLSEITHRPTGGSSITSYIGHEAKVRRDPSLSYTNNGCHSCQMREQVKAENLESIKRHILLRLEMQTLPNITAPQVPQTIIENFYKIYSFTVHKKTSSTSTTSPTSIPNSRSKNTLKYNKDSLSESELFLNNNNNNRNLNANDGIKKSDNMQGDDPNIFTNIHDHRIDHQVDDNEEDVEEDKDEDMVKNNLEDEFFSVTNSVYVFPTMPRMRHTRKAEILNFKFKGNRHSTISQALLHVYIRGQDWIRENEPDLSVKKIINDDQRQIVITIHRVIRRKNSTVATHTVNVNEYQHKIPNGPGQWISIDVTQLVQGWVQNATTNQGIVIKAAESWMKPFIITGDLPSNKEFTIYIEMLTKDNRKRRTKRNTSMNCSESDNEERCCRYPLVVNFVEFDWTWVVAPTQFNAYFCNGECKLGFLEKYPHTHLMQLSTAPQPCCSPTKMSPLRLLYFNTENTLVMSTIPNMAVEKCSCS